MAAPTHPNVNFRDLSCSSLSNILKSKGITYSAKKKEELVHLCHQAEVLNLPEIHDREDEAKLSQSRRTFKGTRYPNPNETPGGLVWSTNLSGVPSVDAFDVTSFLTSYCGWSMERVKRRKTDKGFQLHCSGHIHDVSMCTLESLPTPIADVTSQTGTDSGHEGYLKRRFSTTLDRIFKNRSSAGSTSSDISIEMTHIDEDTDDDLYTDDSGESDGTADGEAMMPWSGMEGHTNLQFMFDNQCHLDNLQPEVVMTFPRNKKVGCLSDASDVMYIGDGRSLVVDMIANHVLHFNKRGVSSIAYSTDHMVEPWAVAVDTEDVVHVTSRKSKCVTRFSKNGEIKTPIKNVNFVQPSGIAIGKNDRIYVSDITSNLLTAHETDGTFIATIGNSLSPIQHLDRPRYVTVAPSNDIIVCDSGNHSLKVFDSDGNFVQKIGERGKGEGQLKFPYGVCTDLHGNIIVADHYNDRVSFFSKNGQFIRHLVTSTDGLTHPQGVCLTSNLRLLVTHGGLKASEVLVYDLRNNQSDTTSTNTVVFV